MDYLDIEKHSQEAEISWGSSYDVLWPVIKAKKLKVGAEIGVAFGGHSERILSRTSVKLYCIDPYKHIDNYDDAMNVSNKEFNRLFNFTKNRLSKFGDRVQMVRKTSVAATNVITIPLDFVYIDGDHSIEGVTQDIIAWFPKVVDGGIISGHDYGHPNFPGVKATVDKFFSRFNWEIHSHSSGAWWVQKQPLNISYIMPAYNCSATIEESIKSIYQTNFMSGDELVVVDDLSVDKTLSILNKLSKKYKNLRVIQHKYHKGGGGARNTAVENTKNELIFCLDSDNILVKHSVSSLKDHLISQISGASSFQQLRYFQENISKVSHNWELGQSNYTAHNYFASNMTPGSSGNYLFTKNSWIKAGRYSEDSFLDTWGFGLRQVMSGSAISVLPKSFYYHRVGHESYWVRESKKHNTSLAATQLLIPFLDKLHTADVDYIFSKKYRLKWFDRLGARPLRLKLKNSNQILSIINNLMGKK